MKPLVMFLIGLVFDGGFALSRACGSIRRSTCTTTVIRTRPKRWPPKAWLRSELRIDSAPMGHAHVYADDVRITRALGPWLDLPGVTPGTEIRVELNSNTHSSMAVDGAAIAATIIVPAD